MSFNKRVLSPGAGPFVNNENFKAITYTGNGGTQAITGLGFKPDFVWIKNRDSSSQGPLIQDSSRGTGSSKVLFSSETASEGTYGQYGHVSAFGSDGFTVVDGSGKHVNSSNEKYVAWCWKAGGGTTSSNSDGEITTNVQANQDAGFSIVTFDGITDPGEKRSFGHGLSQAPEFIWMKRRGSAQHPAVFAQNSGSWGYFDGTSSTSVLYDYASNITVNSTVIDIVDLAEWFADASSEYVYWCWHSVAGYSKIGTYTGNGSATGPIVNTGFEPAFLMIKRVDSTDNWYIVDNARSTVNPREAALFANLGDSEYATYAAKTDFLSNGFQIVSTDNATNSDGGTYLYFCFAANPDEEAPTLSSSFNIETYKGTGGNKSITNLGFEPGFIWLKNRSQGGYAPRIFDIVRGATKRLQSSTTATESSDSTSLTSFDADGFSLGSDNYVNNSGDDFIAWTFKADDNEPTINTNGNITSITSVNANAGFSIVKYHGNNGSSGTIGHGLSSAPELIITKALNFSAGWPTQAGGSFGIRLNEDGGNQSGNGNVFYGNTSPTSTVYTVGGSDETNDDYDYIAYCFHSVAGYSKVGTYTGSTSGVTITTGFKPDFIFIKSSSNVEHWAILDTRRGNFKVIKPNTNDAESDSTLNTFTVTSTGFSFPHQDTADAMLNENGYQYIYMAVAKNVPSNTTLANSFKALQYTGTGVDNLAVTGVGFRSDLIWIKNLSLTRDHNLADTVQGPLREITPNTNEAVENRSVRSFDSDGFTLDNASGNYNENGAGYIAWCWKAGNTWQSNVDGNISSTVNVNTTNGFSIVRYRGAGGSSAQTVGHGLSSAPELIFFKKTSSTQDWYVFSVYANSGTNPANYFLKLNSSDAETENTGSPPSLFAGTAPTSTVFSVGSTLQESADYMAYCWHSVSGYSKIGTYTGNSNNSHSITGLGFQPDFVMIKGTTSGGAGGWYMFDSSRGVQNYVRANLSSAQSTGASSTLTSFDSDGFTLGNDGFLNNNTHTYLYMAFKMN